MGGVHSGATINVIYSSKQPTVPATLRKPLIIVENMDAFQLAPSLQSEPYTLSTFINLISNQPGSSFDFNGQLDDIAGYDLVFINFNDGVDGIVRNAAVVQAAITAVNNAKQFDSRSGRREQNVVMGIGTGGLHARYALANMTKNFASTPTETRLLITHDAPHRGANIALGLQHLSRMLGNFSYFGITSRQIFPEFDETIAFLEAPINRDILIYRAISDVASTTNSFLATTYRAMVDYPSPYQFVPTSLGNECANPLFVAGRQFINFNQSLTSETGLKFSLFGIETLKIAQSQHKFECEVFASSIPTQASSVRKIAAVKTTFKYSLWPGTAIGGVSWSGIQIIKIGYEYHILNCLFLVDRISC
jgi:hypothetical protein